MASGIGQTDGWFRAGQEPVHCDHRWEFPEAIQWTPGAYGKLAPIPQGRYWVGLVYESQSAGRGQAKSSQGYQSIVLLLDGRVIQQGSTLNPVQLAPEVWHTEVGASQAETLKAQKPPEGPFWHFWHCAPQAGVLAASMGALRLYLDFINLFLLLLRLLGRRR